MKRFDFDGALKAVAVGVVNARPGMVLAKNESEIALGEMEDIILNAIKPDFAHFVLDVGAPDDGLHAAYEAAKIGLLNPPFERCVFHCDRSSDGGRDLILMVCDEKGVRIIAFNGSSYSPYPVRVIVEDGAFVMQMVEGAGEDQEDWGNYIAALYTHVISIVSATGTEENIIPAPEKLNRRRMKKGKTPIPEYREIIIGGTKSQSGEHQGGTHRSPIPHMRRGHIRELESGTKTWVRPSFVNSGANPKTYIVKGAEA